MSFRVHPLLLCALCTLLSASACNETMNDPGDTPVDCDASPCHQDCRQGVCDPACATPEERCSDVCIDPSNPPVECLDPDCDALCDPCDADCNACVPTCSDVFIGPALQESSCDATFVEDVAGGATRWEILFSPPSDAPSWLLLIWDAAHGQLVAVEWTLPDNATIDPDTWIKFNDHQQNISPALVSILNPMAPKHQDLLQQGNHSLVVDVEGDDPPCWRLTAQLPPQEDLPFRLRVRLVAAGSAYEDVEAMQADALLNEALRGTQAQFADAGIALHVHGWVVADEATRQEFAEIDDAEHAHELLAALPAETTTNTLTELRVDVALVDRFRVESSLIGLTGGLPGPVALHAHESAGVVLSTSLLPFYRGPEQVANILAHELGHYLGLRHTTSWPTLGFDPLDDTPECSQSVFDDDSNACPDAYNMMFPLLSMREDHWWSAEQMQVMRWHPAVTQRTE